MLHCATVSIFLKQVGWYSLFTVQCLEDPWKAFHKLAGICKMEITLMLSSPSAMQSSRWYLRLYLHVHKYYTSPTVIIYTKYTSPTVMLKGCAQFILTTAQDAESVESTTCNYKRRWENEFSQQHSNCEASRQRSRRG